jgi:hypothetical protein
VVAVSFSALELLTSFLGSATAGEYIAFLDFIEISPEHDARIEEMRTILRDSTRCATTAGYGPRYLHSTGQLHKGGPANGLFLMLEDADRQDVPVPNEPYTFSILKHAQALGDFKALGDHGRRALRIDLGKDAAAGLEEFATLIGRVCERIGQPEPEASVGTGAD